MKYVYHTLEIEIYKKGLEIQQIAVHLNISPRALRNKLKGITSFTWPEVCKIHREFFPAFTKDELFALADKPQQTA